MLAKRILLAPSVHSRTTPCCLSPWKTLRCVGDSRRALVISIFPTRPLVKVTAVMNHHGLSGTGGAGFATIGGRRGTTPQSLAQRETWTKPQLMTFGVRGAFDVGGSARNFAGVRGSRKSRMFLKGDVPLIPSFIGLRELADLLRFNPKKLFRAMGGQLSKKKWRVVLSGIPYAFDAMGHVIVPFQDAQAVAHRLGKKIRFLDVDMRPERAKLGVPVDSEGEKLAERGDGARRPVVVLLGHFNHGKTTILDALLGPDSGIAEGEARGITQEIRARTISLQPSGSTSEVVNGPAKNKSSATSALVPLATFLDTPGQEIFYRMRTNGARVADTVLLVISAVDGVCLQTSESIGCAEELGLPTVVVLNKIDLLPEEQKSQRLSSLSEEVREFVATSNAEVVPISAKTGYGLDHLRQAVASALAKGISASTTSPHGTSTSDSPASGVADDATTIADAAGSGGEPNESEPVHGSEVVEALPPLTFADGFSTVGLFTPAPTQVKSSTAVSATVESPTIESPTDSSSTRSSSTFGSETDEWAAVEAPPGAATATVLDYVSNAKSGKVMLMLVDVGVLRIGDWFASGRMWGTVRLILDEEGIQQLDHAGPGMAVKVVVVARERVADAPLGEPFRVLTKDAALQVALVRRLASLIDKSIDHWRMEKEFGPVLDAATSVGLQSTDSDGFSEDEVDEDDDGGDEHKLEEGEDEDQQGDESRLAEGSVSNQIALRASTLRALRNKASEAEEDHLAQEDMPVTIVVKADTANALACVMDAIGDWREWQEKGTVEESHATGIDLSRVEDKERGWRPKQRLIVNVARSGVGAVTSSDVKLAEDCESPVFAHNVKPDSQANKRLQQKGWSVVSAAPEGALDHPRSASWAGGQVVVSETVGELLGEIERFVLSVR